MVEYDDISGELDLYEKGRLLKPVYKTEAWDIIMATLEAYAEQANEDLLDLLPGDPFVPTAHAAAAALKSNVIKAQQDFARAIETARNPPEEVLTYLMQTKESLDVAKATGHEGQK